MHDRYEVFIDNLPEEARDRTLIALKGHLLLETCLREYIFNRVKHPERLRNKQHSFSVLIDFASCLEDNESIFWVWSALRKANKIRNQLAHQLNPDKVDLYENDFISYVESHDGELSISTDRELKYEKLALVFFQLFDVLVQSVTVKGKISGEAKVKMSRALNSFKSLSEVVEAEFDKYVPKNRYEPYKLQRPKKAKRIW